VPLDDDRKIISLKILEVDVEEMSEDERDEFTELCNRLAQIVEELA